MTFLNKKDDVLNVHFGSKLTMNLTKYLSAHLAHVLGVDRQDLINKISAYSTQLQQYLGFQNLLSFIYHF